MKKFLLLLLCSIVLLLPSEAFARKYVDPVFGRHHRTHVVIHKRYRVAHPIVRPIVHPIAAVTFVVPPIAVFYDLQRRTSCEGDVLGLGGPGFSEPIPVGNVMTTAYMRGECPGVAPRR